MLLIQHVALVSNDLLAGETFQVAEELSCLADRLTRESRKAHRGRWRVIPRMVAKCRVSPFKEPVALRRGCEGKQVALLEVQRR